MNFRQKTIFLITVFLLYFSSSSAQVVINEASNRNYTQVADEDGEYKDWIELYNNSGISQDLSGWSLSDNPELSGRWKLPAISFEPNSFLLIFASGKDKNAYVAGENWQSPILPTDNFQWMVPKASTHTNWNTMEYIVTGWGSGQAGFGYGDNDDYTIIPNGTPAVYIRKIFTVPNTDAITKALFHVDYDDGFVAYINGVEICRNNVSGTPTWESWASDLREATMISGGAPDRFELDMGLLSSVLVEGDNVFSVEVHNRNASSSDLSLIPFLSFAIEEGNSFYPSSPIWITNSETDQLHTSFKLDAQGETVYLFDGSDALINSLEVMRTELDYSIGRKIDGSDTTAIFVNATPGSSNNLQNAYINGYEPLPYFDMAAGFYDSKIEVSISITSQSSTIRYTIDGSDPILSSNIYTGVPISISESTVLRARCFSNSDKLPSLINSVSYFIGDDYTIPVLSVITDPTNLYGATGIFSNNRESWNKPCFVEYFDTLHMLAFRQEAGIQVDGGAGGSRTQPQTSFRIEPGHSVFGAGNLNYQLQPDRPERLNYSSFYLRNGSNQYLILPYKDGAEVKGMAKNTHNYYSAYSPIAVHINGGFYGIYELREKINANYLEANYGMNTDSLDLLGVSYFKGMWLQATEGSIDGFNSDVDYFLGLNTSSTSYLEEVSTFMDLDNYTDYMIGEIWIGNNDWPQNNIKTWRCAGTDYRWQWAIIDMEWALRPHEWTNSSFDAFQYLKNRGMSTIYSGFWLRMMDNTSYRHKFINRFADLMNTSYSSDTLRKIEQQMYDEAVVEMPKEYERWGNSDIAGQMNTYYQNHLTFRSELAARSAYVRQYLQAHYSLSNQITVSLYVDPPEAGRIQISTIIPDTYPWSGTYFSDIPIKIEAIAYPGYTFKDWDDNAYINTNTNSVFSFTFNGASPTFAANFEAGESNYSGITISEISYKDGINLISTDWFEIYNSTSENLDLEGWYFTDNDTTHQYNFDALSIPAGKRIVVAENKYTFQALYPEIHNVTGGFSFGLDSYADEIKLYNSEDELVVSVAYSNSYPWPLEDNMEGRSIELVNPEKDLDDPYNWMAGCPTGSPGYPYRKCGTSIPVSLEDTVSPSEGYLALRAYPNPARNELNLEFYLSNPVDQANIRIYNIQGNLIQSKSSSSLSAGTQTIPMNLSKISANQMLFVVVSAGSLNETVKVIKQ